MAENTPVTIDVSPQEPDWTAVLKTDEAGNTKTDLCHCDDGLMVSVPFKCNWVEAVAIVRAYRIGHAHGVINGGRQVQRDMLKVLGL